MELRPASHLREVLRVLHPDEALSSPAELSAYYVDLDRVRGGGLVRRVELQLDSAFEGKPFRAFVFGHSGAGKSTEFSRLAADAQVSQRFAVVRFSAKDDMDPNRLGPIDVIVTMLIRLIAEAGKRKVKVPAKLAEKVYRWLTVERHVSAQQRSTEGSAAAGAGGGGDAWWAKLLGLSAKIGGEMKFSSFDRKEYSEEIVRRQSELLELANDFLDAAGKKLLEVEKRKWLFIGEDFEKVNDPGIPSRLFVGHAHLFAALRANMILTIPVALAHSAQRTGLPFDAYPLYDIPVFDGQQRPHLESRGLLRDLLYHRVPGRGAGWRYSRRRRAGPFRPSQAGR